jgi:hypothetical protein
VSELFFSVSELFLVDDFFELDGEAEASALALELFLLVLDALVPDFFDEPFVVVLEWVVVALVDAAAVSLFLFAQDV